MATATDLVCLNRCPLIRPIDASLSPIRTVLPDPHERGTRRRFCSAPASRRRQPAVPGRRSAPTRWQGGPRSRPRSAPPQSGTAAHVAARLPVHDLARRLLDATVWAIPPPVRPTSLSHPPTSVPAAPHPQGPAARPSAVPNPRTHAAIPPRAHPATNPATLPTTRRRSSGERLCSRPTTARSKLRRGKSSSATCRSSST